LTATLIALLLVLSATFGALKLAPHQRSSYYVWRLQKSNATDPDRYRARTYLLANMDSAGSPYRQLGEMLESPTITPGTADNILDILLNSRQQTLSQTPALHGLLINGLHNTNSDIRGRIQKVLIYLAREQSLTLEPTLANWQSDPKNSSSDLDTIIKEWNKAWATSESLRPATLTGQPQPTAH
jgi:hypothetical protein